MTQNPSIASQVQAYIFKDHQLIVDDQLSLPWVDFHQSDVVVKQQAGYCIVVREFTEQIVIPDGFQLTPVRQLVSRWTNSDFEQASRAMQLLEWKKNHQFCSRCGQKNQSHNTELCMVCPSCCYTQYPRIQPCVIVAIIKDNQQILLARSAQRPTPMFSLIAGFVEVGETLEQAVAREVMEEVGLSVKNIQYMNSQPWPFPSNLMLGFKADYAGGDLVLQEDEIAEANFFNFDQLPHLPFKGSIAAWMIDQIIQAQ